MPKPFKTIDEQIKLLKDRGLIIDDLDIELTRDFLLRNNYYRISGYTLTLRKHDVFYPGTSIRDVIEIYAFDRELRNLILGLIEIIEVTFKSIYAYEYSLKHDGLGYLHADCFTDFDKYISVMNKSLSSKKGRLKEEAYIQHYVKELKEPLPIWALVDLLTIHDISVLYSITDAEVQKCVAKRYGLTHNKANAVVGNYLYSTTILRNLCAHDGRLYNRLFITKPSLNNKELDLLNLDNNGNPDNSRLFGYILVLRRLVLIDDFRVFKNKLIELTHKYPFVDMAHYGFCRDWVEKL